MGSFNLSLEGFSMGRLLGLALTGTSPHLHFHFLPSKPQQQNHHHCSHSLNLQRQASMCFFLEHLFFPDLCFTGSTVPQLLINLSQVDQTISYAGCVAQLFITLLLGVTDYVFLVAMAFIATVCITESRKPIWFLSDDVLHSGANPLQKIG